MSNLLSLSSVLRENTLGEKLLAKTYSNDSYLCTSLNNLRRLNESFIESSEELYTKVNEADSTDTENDAFCEYFCKYKESISKYITDLEGLASRFSINMENLLDSCRDYATDQELLNTPCEFQYQLIEYKHLGDTRKVKFDPLSIYHKEFDFIGKMIKDLGPISTDAAKMQIIATVYNELTKDMKNKWLEKTIEDIIDEEDCKDMDTFAEKTKAIFKGETKDVTVDKTMVFTSIQTLDTCEQYKDSALAVADRLIADFRTLADQIGCMCYRNQDKKINIDSKNYQLDSYGMNQFNIFMKAKINQINQMCSLYTVALSIKMDAITEYTTQIKELLAKAKENLVAGCKNGTCDAPIETEPETPDTTGDESPESQPPVEKPTPDGDTPQTDSDIDDNGINDEQELTGEEPEMDTDGTDEDIPASLGIDYDKPGVHEPGEPAEEELTDPGEPSSENPQTNDMQEACDLFEYTAYMIEAMFDTEVLNNNIRSLLEADEKPGDGGGASTPANNNNNQNPGAVDQTVKGMADNANAAQKAWATLVEKIKELFRKFMNTFVNHNKKRCEYIKKQQGTLNKLSSEKKIPEKIANDDGTTTDGFTIAQYDPNALMSINIPAFNWEGQKDALEDKNKFAATILTPAHITIGDNEDFVAAIKKAVLGEDKDKVAANGVLGNMIDFCINFESKYYKPIEDDIKDLDRAKVAAGATAKKMASDISKAPAPAQDNNGGGEKSTGESASFDDFFASLLNEADFTAPSGQAKDSQGNMKKDISKALSNYFNVCCRITSAKMTCAQKIFNSYYGCLHAILKYNGLAKDAPGNDQDNTNKAGETPKEENKPEEGGK